MKYFQLITVFIFIWSNSFSQTITIDKFEDQSYEKFDPVDENQQEITAKIIKEGFYIQIIDTSGVEAIQIKNDAGQFNNVTNPEIITKAKLYKIVDPALENNGKTCIIKLIKSAQEKTLTLTIKSST